MLVDKESGLPYQVDVQADCPMLAAAPRGDYECPKRFETVPDTKKKKFVMAKPQPVERFLGMEIKLRQPENTTKQFVDISQKAYMKHIVDDYKKDVGIVGRLRKYRTPGADGEISTLGVCEASWRTLRRSTSGACCSFHGAAGPT